MVQPVVLKVVESCAVITRVLATTRYNGFAVVDEKGLFRGTILRSQLSVMLYERQRFQQAGRDIGHEIGGAVESSGLDGVPICEGTGLDTYYGSNLSHSDFLQYYPRFPLVKDLLSDENIDGCMLNLEHVLNGSALTVTPDTHGD